MFFGCSNICHIITGPSLSPSKRFACPLNDCQEIVHVGRAAPGKGREDHAEEVADAFVLQWTVAYHGGAIENHSLLNTGRYLVDIHPPVIAPLAPVQ